MDDVTFTVSRAPGVKCPRCWHVTGEGRFNFDGLCDRCCDVLIHDYPTHESVPLIVASRAEQRAQWGVVARPS